MATTNHLHGVLQTPGAKCLDHWHCAYNDRVDHDCGPLDTYSPEGSSCPTCQAVMMAGGAVTPAFYVEYKRRLVEKICLVSYAGEFVHAVPAAPEALAGGACLCAKHNR